MMEGAPQIPTLEKKARMDFTFGNGEAKFIELTEKAPGVYVISNENLIPKIRVEGDYNENTLAFKPEDNPNNNVEVLEMDASDSEYYDIFGYLTHFKLDGVEFDARDQDNIIIKASSLEKAIQILKVSNPWSYDWRDR